MQPPSPCCACLEGREEPRVDGWSGMGKSGPETSRLTSPAAARCVRVGPSAVAARSCGDETLVRPASPPPPRGVTFMRVRVSSRVFVSARPRPRHPVRGLPAHHEPARAANRRAWLLPACGAIRGCTRRPGVDTPAAGDHRCAADTIGIRISRAGPPPAEARGGDTTGPD